MFTIGYPQTRFMCNAYKHTLFLSMRYTIGGILIQQCEMEYWNRINSIIESIDHLYQHAYSREILNM